MKLGSFSQFHQLYLSPENNTKMNTVNIDTTQNVQIEYELANLGDRILAYIIDGLIIGGYIVALSFLSALLMPSGRDFAFVVLILIYLPLVFYFLLFEIFMDGQSPGKRLRKIKVVKLDGTQASIGNYLLRWILRPIDSAMAIGLFTIILSRHGQRLGDMAAGTTVIKVAKRIELSDTIFKEVENEYVPVFDNVDKLTEKHIELIKRVLNDYKEVRNYEVVDIMFEKTKDILDAQTDLYPIEFLETVVKDYNYYMGR